MPAVALAVKVGAVWNVGVVNDSTNPEANPDTNGALVVYDSLRGGNSDIFWRTVAGGPEVQLEMASSEGNPSIAGNFIAYRLSFGGIDSIFDFDGDGAVAASDFIQFRLRFGESV